GIYAGAVTNTPALGAPWQTLSTLVLDCAHTEAQSVRGGVGRVKLLGPARGFHQGRRRSREPGRQFRTRPPKCLCARRLSRRVEAADVDEIARRYRCRRGRRAGLACRRRV